MLSFSKSSALAAIYLMASSSIVMADQIDGTWCSPDGEIMTINGSRVTLPDGETIVGNYNRHHVDFESPGGEFGAGALISADQLNEQSIRVATTGGSKTESDSDEIWMRCEVVS